MNALPILLADLAGPHDYRSAKNPATNEACWTALVDERAAEIDNNADKVIGLFMDEALTLNREHRGNGHNELIELSVYAMNAWPVMERMIAGLPITPVEATYPPALFRALRPLIDRRAVLVREAAEDEIKAEALEVRA